jgi:hypothetical protein
VLQPVLVGQSAHLRRKQGENGLDREEAEVPAVGDPDAARLGHLEPVADLQAADGAAFGDYSLVCFGALIVEPGLGRSFYGRLKPISEQWIPEELAVSGFSREETLAFDDPKEVMERFASWLEDNGGKRLVFISDNNLRMSRHTHHPVDDARGNAEALLHMKQDLGLRIALD